MHANPQPYTDPSNLFGSESMLYMFYLPNTSMLVIRGPDLFGAGLVLKFGCTRIHIILG